MNELPEREPERDAHEPLLLAKVEDSEVVPAARALADRYPDLAALVDEARLALLEDVGPGGGSTVDVDPSKDAARIQTNALNDAIASGETKLDFGKKSKNGKTTLGAEYKKWIESSDPIDYKGKQPKANYNGDPEFKSDIDEIVAKGKIADELRIQQSAKALDELKLKLDPRKPDYAANRAKLVDKFGIDIVEKWENTTLGDASDPARKKLFDQINKVVAPDAITRLRNAFPDCEIYITGKATEASAGKADPTKIKKIEVTVVVPEGTDGNGKLAYEDRGRALSLPVTPEFEAAAKQSSLPVDVTARTKAEAFEAVAASKGDMARVDANTGNAAETRVELRAAKAGAATGGSSEGPDVKPKAKPRVTEPVPGLFDHVKSEPKIADWQVTDKGPLPGGKWDPALVEPNGTKVCKTYVQTPDGKGGWMERAYNPKTKTFEMRNAFLEDLPGWVNEGGPALVDGKGTPTVTYLTLRQMKLLGADFGGIKKFKMSTIQNVRAVIELNAAVLGGADPNTAVLNTHSVQYADTAIVQAGEKITGAKVSGDIWNTPLDEMLNHYETNGGSRAPDPDVVAKHDKLIADFGKGKVTRKTKVMWNYDIELDVQPFK